MTDVGMRFDRLENLIVALRDGVPDDFTMSSYGDPTAAGCATPCCVFGHYAHRGDLQDAFVLRPLGAFAWVYMRAAEGTSIDDAVEYDDAVVCAHFGISVDQARELFGGAGCDNATDRDDAIAYIRDFIDRHKTGAESAAGAA